MASTPAMAPPTYSVESDGYGNLRSQKYGIDWPNRPKSGTHSMEAEMQKIKPGKVHKIPMSPDDDNPAAMMQDSKPVEVHKIPMSPDDDDSAMMMKHRKKGQQKRLDESEEQGCCATCLTILSCIFIIFTFPFSLCCCIKIVKQYERAVIFRLGKLRSGGAKGPGVFFINPCIDNYKKVDLRVVAFNVPPQEVLSKDSVTVAVDGVVYFQIRDPIMAICNIKNAAESTQMLAQSKLRMVLGTKTLGEMLSGREQMAHELQEQLDDATDPWGVTVERVEIKDIRLPNQMQRAMAAEAEATREAKAKVIAAEGEQKAAKNLQEASKIISESPAALQLRYLQTLNTISAERNSTIIFPFPVDFISSMLGKGCCQCQHHGAAQSAKTSGVSSVRIGQTSPDTSVFVGKR